MKTKRNPARRSAKKPALRLTRVLAAPRALVFAAWTQSAHLRKWSAPHGFKIPVSEGELKPGGAWRAVMVSPDGMKLPLGGVYRKVVPNRLLVFTHQWTGEEGSPATVVTVRLADAPRGGTKMTFSQTGFDSTAAKDGHADGWSQGFERLEALLAKLRQKA
jgi:uncharacterized protein YndB with AHSA1/START domain